MSNWCYDISQYAIRVISELEMSFMNINSNGMTSNGGDELVGRG